VIKVTDENWFIFAQRRKQNAKSNFVVGTLERMCSERKGGKKVSLGQPHIEYVLSKEMISTGNRTRRAIKNNR
jgi:hypothetical protein